MMPMTGLPRRQKPQTPDTEEEESSSGTQNQSMKKAEKDAEAEYIKGINKRPVIYKEYVPGKGGHGGLVIGVLSLWKGWKSTTAAMWSFYNSAFKRHLGPKTNKLLSTGRLPEIQRVLVIDTEETWERDLDHGFLGMMLKPLHAAGIKIIVESVPLLRKREKVIDGEVINVSNDYDVDKMRDNFESAVWHARDLGEGTLVLVDSMSDYKDMITDEQEEMFGKTITTKFKGEVDDENVNVDRKFYRYRNKWWTNILMKLRNSGLWVAETYKIEEREEEYRYKDVKIRVGKDKSGKAMYREESILLDQYFPVWVKKSEYRIDQGYSIVRTIDSQGNDVPAIRVDWAKHRHSVPQFSKIPKDQREEMQPNCCLTYPMNDRMAMMYLIEDMAPALLQEEFTEEQLWGKYDNDKEEPKKGV